MTSGAAPADAASKATTLSLTSNADRGTRGQAVSLSGLLASGNQALAARPVTVSFRKRNARAYTLVATVRTDSTGRYLLAEALTTTGTWKIDYRGDAVYRSAVATRTVTVTATKYQLVASYDKVAGRLYQPYDDTPPAWQWSSDYFRQMPRDYRIDWSYSCGATASIDSWELYWIGAGDTTVDIADAGGTKDSGSFSGHDGWNAESGEERYLQVEISGTRGDSCRSSIKLYSVTRVAV